MSATATTAASRTAQAAPNNPPTQVNNPPVQPAAQQPVQQPAPPAAAGAGGGGGGGAGGGGGGGGQGQGPPGGPGGPAGQPPGGAQQPVQGVFALTPNAVDDQWIDYTTKVGLKKYEKATASLQNKFDGSSMAMTVFKADLVDHAEDSGWSNGMQLSDIVHIPKMDHSTVATAAAIAALDSSEEE